VLIANALMRAAQRGVRVSNTHDDAETVAGDSNFWHSRAGKYRHTRFSIHGDIAAHRLLRGTEFLFSRTRLDYRMHNKLFVAMGHRVFGVDNIAINTFRSTRIASRAR